MQVTNRHRRIARTIWECGGRLDEVAQRENVRPTTLRKWLADPAFRSLLAEDALEPVLQATSAVLRWAPVAVSRLIQDLARPGDDPLSRTVAGLSDDQLVRILTILNDAKGDAR